MAAAAEPVNPHLASPITSPALPSASTTISPDATSPPGLALPMAALDQQYLPSRASGGRRASSPPRGRPGLADDIERVAAKLERDLSNGRDSQQHQQPANKSRRGSSTAVKKTSSSDNVQRLPAAEMQELMKSPDSLPVGPAPPHRPSFDHGLFSEQKAAIRKSLMAQPDIYSRETHVTNGLEIDPYGGLRSRASEPRAGSPRTLSTPPTSRAKQFELSPYMTSSSRFSAQPSQRPPPLNLNIDDQKADCRPHTTLPSPAMKTGPPALSSAADIVTSGPRPPSPMPAIIPLPPMSLPTHLQLELAAQRPSPLYIHHSHTNDIPYESSAVKFERLKNVLLIPPYLERTLYFGALACLDAWLHTFTILPIRFILALAVLVRWWAHVATKESKWLVGFVWEGIGRLRERGRDRSRRTSEVTNPDRSRSCSRASEPAVDGHDFPIQSRRPEDAGRLLKSLARDPGPKSGVFRHRRTKSTPSSLSAFHKADLLQGAVIICSSFALMTLDASRMYHFIRAQSAIKLYVIYNILEVGDRLLSALGQDILECLFSSETLSRTASGRSKVLLPMGMFCLALAYNCLHSIALYYQVITLNVAVNSYSNALLTLLLSNQFVEIKSTVFKRFEKDNLFQLTCADIVERFHLWIMLLIIGMRNIVEVGGLSVPGAGFDTDTDSAAPLHHPSILPHSFTALPSWLMSGEVLSPFLIVVGSEMLVDTIKHAYVTKFNNIKPNFYSRTLDILCKDYYTNAFTAPSLTKRLGLAVIPLSCLFIRSSIQTYHMFLSTYLPMPIPQSTQTSLSEESATPSSPAVMAAINRFDALIRDSLGRATYGYPYGSPLNSRPWYAWTSDDFIAALTMVVVFFIAFLVLLIVKLLLGMALLKYARTRYARMKTKELALARVGGSSGKVESSSYEVKGGRRIGARAEIEVGDDRQRWIHADKNEGLKGGKGPSGRRPGEEKKQAQDGEIHGVMRYEMVSKRIW